MAMVTQKYLGTVCIVMGIAVAALKFLLSFVKCTRLLGPFSRGIPLVVLVQVAWELLLHVGGGHGTHGVAQVAGTLLLHAGGDCGVAYTTFVVVNRNLYIITCLWLGLGRLA